MKLRTPGPMTEEKSLVGWKEIADYLGLGQATVRRLASRPRFSLPYHVTLGHPWASPTELQVWLRQNTIPGQERELRRARVSTDEQPIDEEAEKVE
jgi:predicted DNA-binding transcriptional regulator AlpA